MGRGFHASAQARMHFRPHAAPRLGCYVLKRRFRNCMTRLYAGCDICLRPVDALCSMVGKIARVHLGVDTRTPFAVLGNHTTHIRSGIMAQYGEMLIVVACFVTFLIGQDFRHILSLREVRLRACIRECDLMKVLKLRREC